MKNQDKKMIDDDQEIYDMISDWCQNLNSLIGLEEEPIGYAKTQGRLAYLESNVKLCEMAYEASQRTLHNYLIEEGLKDPDETS
jgi:hypothetical protein